MSCAPGFTGSGSEVKRLVSTTVRPDAKSDDDQGLAGGDTNLNLGMGDRHLSGLEAMGSRRGLGQAPLCRLRRAFPLHAGVRRVAHCPARSCRHPPARCFPRTGYELPARRTPGPQVASASMKTILAPSRARRIAAADARCSSRCPLSKARTVLRLISARTASSSWVQFKSALAARHCSGVNGMGH
jgi:hypothetical protein